MAYASHSDSVLITARHDLGIVSVSVILQIIMLQIIIQIHYMCYNFHHIFEWLKDWPIFLC